MIEVHPPHEDVHSWRQFFIHIVAITIGLLIAIGLEQTVVYFHHRRQLQEARRELADELESNRRVVGINLEATRKTMLRWRSARQSTLVTSARNRTGRSVLSAMTVRESRAVDATLLADMT